MTLHVTLLARHDNRIIASSDKWEMFGEERGRLTLRVDGDEVTITCIDADDAEAIAQFINERGKLNERERFRQQLTASLEAAE